MQRFLHDPLLHDPFGEGRTDAVSKLFQQCKADDVIEPAAGFYGRVMDEIAVERLSVWFLLAHTSFAFRLVLSCMSLALLVLLLVARGQHTVFADYRSAITELTSTHPEERRDAVLVMILADPPVSRQAR